MDDCDGSTQSFEAGCSEMFAGLQQVLQPAGYQIMLAESQHRLEQEEKLLETLLASNIAAAILLSVEHSDTVRHWLKRLYPGDGNGCNACRSY